MSFKSFVHLHVHSEYSLLEACTPVSRIVDKVARLNQPAVALTDHGNLYGAIEFYFACKAKNIKPILGLDAWISPEGRTHKSGDRNEANKQLPRLVLLAKSYRGYQSLSRISSAGFLEGFYYRPRVDLETLAQHKEDLICLTGNQFGWVAQCFRYKGREAALELILKLKAIYQDNLYLEVTRHGLPHEAEYIPFLQEVSKSHHIPLVATNDVFYLNPEDRIAQEILICIGTNRTLADDTRFTLGSDEFYLKNSESMYELFSDLPEAVENTLQIAEQIHIEFKLKDPEGRPIYHLPSYPTREGRSLKDEIRALSVEGLNKRFQFKERGGVRISDKEREKYQERLEYELSIIDRMGFNGYFLIVADFINFAKTHNIPVGPGRGSGAGSLVAFSLGITDLDPLPYNLLFERFLNPERISMPDFDVDFCQDRRAEVIEYVTQKYGKESVAQIVTFGKLQPKAAIKDVGRVLGMTFSEVDRISKLVPSTPKITLDEALEQEPRLKELVETDPQAASVINLSKKVEGLVRHSGVHAAGVVITSGQIVEIAPVSKGAAGEIVIQFDMIHAEKMGLVKFDFLGLKTLTHIQKALDQVELEKKIKIRPEEISIEDPNIYKVFCKGDTLGIFQFEGEGITEATIKIQPESFFDITAINALYRPGPMEMIPSYTARRWGKEPIEYLFKELEEILSETKGVIVYQEQVMAIASKIAGYSLGEADVLRRAIGKKKLEEMQKLQASFLQRSVDRGFEKKKVEELWELLVKFANYGFNKSHAAAYCVLSAQTAWLKYYYPAEFFAGLMSTEIANTDSIVRYSKDAIKHGIELLPPHINSSEYLFTVKEGKIHFALGAIKGVGVAPAQSIVKARKSQPFSKFECLEDFFLSVDLKCFNKKTLEALIKAGVLDDLGVERGVLLENYSQYLDWAQRRRRESETGQGSLFDLVEDYKETLKLPEKHSWDRARYLRAEKEVLGFYLTDHPLRGVQKLAEQVSSCPLSHLAQYYLENFKESALEKAQVSQFSDLRAQWRKPKGVKVRFLGIFNSIEERMTSKGTLMAFAQFEDLFAQAEMLIFPDTYVEVANRIEIGAPVLVEALLQERENQYKLILEKVSTLSESLKTIDRLHFKLSQLNKSDVQLLSQLFEGYAKYWDSPDHVVGGEVLVELSIFLPEFEKWVKIEKGLKAKLSLEFIERLETSLPPHLKEGLEYQLGS